MTAMHPYLRRLFVLAFISACFFAAPAGAAPADPVEADRIVAVVGDEVITQYDLRQRLASALKQLQKQGTPLPPQDVLERQLLERMIIDRVQLQFARETGLKVDDAQLDQAISASPPTTRCRRSSSGGAGEGRRAYRSFREEIRDEMTIVRLREREVDNQIVISEGEIDNYLANQASNRRPARNIRWPTSCCARRSRPARSSLQKLRRAANRRSSGLTARARISSQVRQPSPTRRTPCRAATWAGARSTACRLCMPSGGRA